MVMRLHVGLIASTFSAIVLMLPPSSPSTFMAAAEDTPCADDPQDNLCNDVGKCNTPGFGIIYQTLCPLMCGMCTPSLDSSDVADYSTTTDAPTFEAPVVLLSWGFGVSEVQASATISLGDTVMWMLDLDDQPHDIRSGTKEAPFPNAGFNSPTLQPQESWTFKFEEAGVFPYFCSPHPWMVGTITVVIV